MTTKTSKNIHIQFIDMCADLYKKASPPLRRQEYVHRSLTYSTTLLFLKHLAVSEELTKNWQQIDQDITNNIITPATLLARARYSKTYISMMMHSQINKHMRLATDILEIIPTEVSEYATI